MHIIVVIIPVQYNIYLHRYNYRYHIVMLLLLYIITIIFITRCYVYHVSCTRQRYRPDLKMQAPAAHLMPRGSEGASLQLPQGIWKVMGHH